VAAISLLRCGSPMGARPRYRSDPGTGIMTATPFDRDHALPWLSAGQIAFRGGRGSRRTLYEDETAHPSLRAVPRVLGDHRRTRRDGRWHRHTRSEAAGCSDRGLPPKGSSTSPIFRVTIVRKMGLASRHIGPRAIHANAVTRKQHPTESERHAPLAPTRVVDENRCDAHQPIS
jgi:hypothetical protein